MKYFIIIDRKGSFKGYTNDDYAAEAFFKQRDRKQYRLIIKNEKDLNPELINDMETNYTEIVLNNGIFLFPKEEIEYIDHLNSFINTLSNKIDELDKFCEYIKFKDDEQPIINEFIRVIRRMKEDINDEDSFEMDNFIDHEELITDMIQYKEAR